MNTCKSFSLLDSALLATVIVVSNSQHKLRTKKKITDIGSTDTHNDVLPYSSKARQLIHKIVVNAKLYMQHMTKGQILGQ